MFGISIKSECDDTITEGDARTRNILVLPIEHFRDVILGVWTDHVPVQSIFKVKNLKGRFARWFMTLKNYDAKFYYIPGSKHTADALSRNISSQTEFTSERDERMKMLINSCISEVDRIIQHYFSKSNNLPNPALFFLAPTRLIQHS